MIIHLLKRNTKYLMYGFYVIETLIAEVEKNEASTPINVYTSYLVGKDPTQ